MPTEFRFLEMEEFSIRSYINFIHKILIKTQALRAFL